MEPFSFPASPPLPLFAPTPSNVSKCNDNGNAIGEPTYEQLILFDLIRQYYIRQLWLMLYHTSGCEVHFGFMWWLQDFLWRDRSTGSRTPGQAIYVMHSTVSTMRHASLRMPARRLLFEWPRRLSATAIDVGPRAKPWSLNASREMYEYGIMPYFGTCTRVLEKAQMLYQERPSAMRYVALTWSLLQYSDSPIDAPDPRMHHPPWTLIQ